MVQSEERVRVHRARGAEDLFVHISEVDGQIRDGDAVEFEVAEGPKGPNAVKVSKTE